MGTDMHEPTKIIAELCQNHMGDWGRVAQMTYAAKDAGAWAVKIQSFFADDCAWDSDKERLKKLELSWDEHKKFVDFCRRIDVTPMTSVYSAKYIEKLKQIGFDWIKVGSAQCDDFRLQRAYKDAGFKIIVSTGGNELESVPFWDHVDCYMHCVSQYPTAWNRANLLRFVKMMWHPHVKSVGFSDHTGGQLESPNPYWDIPAKTAMCLGAKYLEKHFVLEPLGDEKDLSVSIDHGKLKELCEFAKKDLPEKREELDFIGLFDCPMTKEEKTLIEKYKTRWIDR